MAMEAISYDAAVALYIGIICDTGVFKYSNTSPVSYTHLLSSVRNSLCRCSVIQNRKHFRIWCVFQVCPMVRMYGWAMHRRWSRREKPRFPQPSVHEMILWSIWSVSYTHLDVYKRQEPNVIRPLGIMWRSMRIPRSLAARQWLDATLLSGATHLLQKVYRRTRESVLRVRNWH